MTTHVYIAASLDGYIATHEGGLEWLNGIPNPDNSDYGFDEFMARMDAVVMGRNTFDVVLGFGEWPYPKPVVVLSRTLTSLPEDLSGRAEIMKGAPAKVLETLQQRGYKRLYIDGGQTIQAFLKADLIDEITITRVPILLGDGISLFGKLTKPLPFLLCGSETYKNGLIKSHYRREQ